VITNTIKENTKTEIDPVGLEVNIEKTRYMLLPHRPNSGQNHDIKIDNRSFENVTQLKYLRTTIMDENAIQDEIKWRLNSGNACYHYVQNFYPLVCWLKS
jgi:hypothetical protein